MKSEGLNAIALALVGLAYAAVTLFLAGALTGAGHGWMAGIGSVSGLLLLPAFGVAYAFRNRRFAKVALAVVFLGAIATDFLIVHLTQNEGVGYFKKALKNIGPIVILWLFLWAAWQLLLLKKLIQAFLGPKLPD